MPINPTPANGDSRSIPVATESGFTVLCALDPFREAIGTLELAVATTEQILMKNDNVKPKLCSAMVLLHYAIDLVAGQAAAFEKAASTLLNDRSTS